MKLEPAYAAYGNVASNVCLSVCVSVCNALTVESTDLKVYFGICGCIFGVCNQFCIIVIASRLRSWEQKSVCGWSAPSQFCFCTRGVSSSDILCGIQTVGYMYYS